MSKPPELEVVTKDNVTDIMTRLQKKENRVRSDREKLNSLLGYAVHSLAGVVEKQKPTVLTHLLEKGEVSFVTANGEFGLRLAVHLTKLKGDEPA